MQYRDYFQGQTFCSALLASAIPRTSNVTRTGLSLNGVTSTSSCSDLISSLMKATIPPPTKIAAWSVEIPQVEVLEGRLSNRVSTLVDSEPRKKFP